MRHHRIFPTLLIVALLLTVFQAAQAHPLTQQTTDKSGWFTFPQRGTDNANTAISAASLLVDTPNQDPATVIDSRGFVKVDANGHFVFTNTNKRVRFWGTNIGQGAAFPPSPNSPRRTGEVATADSAEQLARRLAKLGFNAVRLHHLDNPGWEDGANGYLWEDAANGTQKINLSQLDRLDHLIYQLKRQGIYVNLNLYVGRTFRSNDGVTEASALEGSRITFGKNVSLFDPIMIALQKQYAATLLNHVNPYTGMAYKNDPVIFTTETNNENSLFMGVAADELNYNPADPKSLPEFYSKELDGWSQLAGGPRINRISSPGFEAGRTGWEEYLFTAGSANFDVVTGGVSGNALRATINSTDTQAWHVQLSNAKLAVQAGKSYRVSFALRASAPTSVDAMVMRNSGAYENFGWYESIPVGTSWSTKTVTFVANATSFGDARLSFYMGSAAAGTQIFFDNVSFVESDAFAGWHGWLYKKYGSTAAIAAAWRNATTVNETEILLNNSFENGLTNWQTFVNSPAAATFSSDSTTASQGTKSLLVNISTPGSAAWYVQLNSANLSVSQGQLYQLSFSAKASVAGSVEYGVAQNHTPYDALGFYGTANLTTQWQTFTGAFVATQSDSAARVSIDMGLQKRSVWIDNVSLKPIAAKGLLAGESLEANNIQRMLRSQWAGYTPQRIQDLVLFYSETESNFFNEMRTYIKSLGAQMLNTGTANLVDGLPGTRAMAQTDFVDNHLYWDHPVWPTGIDWAKAGWTIKNQAWVNSPFEGLFNKALLAVKGKPFTVSEFNAITPNQYEAEGPLLMATFANLQDWDGVFMYVYANHSQDYNNEAVTPSDFFEQAGNPIDLSLMPVAARIFYLQQNDPATTESLLRFTNSQLVESTQSGYGGSTADYLTQKFGVVPAAAFGSRLRIADTNAATTSTLTLPAPTGPAYVSSGNQLTWDSSITDRNRYLVNAPNLQSMVGFVPTQTITTTNLQMVFSGVPSGATRNADFAAITLQPAISGTIASASKLILGVFTRFENTGYRWNNSRTSIYIDPTITDMNDPRIDASWGVTPTLIEPIRFNATVKLNNPIGAVVRILDSTGAAIGTVATQQVTGGISFVVDTGKDKTMWYLIESGSASATPTPTFTPTFTPTPTATRTPTPVSGAATIKGKVTQDNGTILSGIQVTAYQLQGSTWTQRTTVTTAADGTYLLPGLAAGSYRLRFQEINGRFVTEYYNNKSTLAKATTIKLSAGQTIANINAALTPIVAAASNNESLQNSLNGQTLPLAGLLIDSQTGQPIANARLVLYHLADWRVATGADDAGEQVCQSPQSLAAGSGFDQLPPANTGDWAASEEESESSPLTLVSPNSNPLLSDSNGAFGWQLSPGCWFVEAYADGYAMAVSPIIGNSAAVDTLVIHLTPAAHTLFLPTVLR